MNIPDESTSTSTSIGVANPRTGLRGRWIIIGVCSILATILVWFFFVRKTYKEADYRRDVADFVYQLEEIHDHYKKRDSIRYSQVGPTVSWVREEILPPYATRLEEELSTKAFQALEQTITAWEEIMKMQAKIELSPEIPQKVDDSFKAYDVCRKELLRLKAHLEH